MGTIFPNHVEILPLLEHHRIGPRLRDGFEARVIRSDGCWGWNGSRYPQGYPKLSYAHGKHIAGHRLSFALTHGQEPGALMVCHRCDNPTCTNPEHLFLGDGFANQRDAWAKGRKRIAGAPLTNEKRAKIGAITAAFIEEFAPRSMTNVAIAKSLGVHHATISLIRKGSRSMGRRLGIEPRSSASQTEVLTIELASPSGKLGQDSVVTNCNSAQGVDSVSVKTNKYRHHKPRLPR